MHGELAYAVGSGPGTQVADDLDPTIEYMPMPKNMRTWQPQFLPDELDPGRHPRLWSTLQSLQSALNDTAQGGEPATIESRALDPGELILLADTLGEGEVSARCDGVRGASVDVQETALIGAWRVQDLDADGVLQSDCLQIGGFPQLTPNGWQNARPAALDASMAEDGSAIMNAAPGLTEIYDRSAAYLGLQDHHVLNFSLLPMTEADLTLVGECLGRGGLSILARGYGNCRITACALANIWWVQYFNSTDQLILNTLEITRMPSVAQADVNDLADSAKRLREMLAVYA